MNDFDQQSIEEKIFSLLSSQNLAVLSTCGRNGVYANLITFAATSDLKTIIFATPRDTLKFANMKFDHRVALLIENSRNRIEDFENAMAVTATGKAEEPKGELRSRLTAEYLNKHSNLADFVHSENCALMLVRVSAYVLVEKFQQVTRLQFQT